MFTPSINLFFLAFLYALTLLIFSLALFNKLSPKHKITRNRVLFVLLLAFLIRFFAIIFFPFASGYDISSFLWAAQKVLERSDIYFGLTVRYHFAFLPTFAILTALLSALASLTKIPVVIFMKTVVILFDSLMAILVLIISRNYKNGIIYALCPIPIIVSAYLGQFDAIVLFCSLLGLYLFRQNKPLLSMLTIGIGAAFKPWPLVLALPLLFKTDGELRKLSLLIFLSLPPALILVLYKLLVPGGDLFTMIGSIALYESVIGWWGPSILFQKLALSLHIKKILTLSAFISKVATIGLIFYLCELLKKKNIFVAGKLIILSIYIFSFGLSIHYLLWILPFALITKDRFLRYYLIFAGSYFLFFGTFNILTYNFSPPRIPDIFATFASLSLWTFFLIWGMKEAQGYQNPHPKND